MSDKNKYVDLNEGYQPKTIQRPSEGNVNLGWLCCTNLSVQAFSAI